MRCKQIGLLLSIALLTGCGPSGGDKGGHGGFPPAQVSVITIEPKSLPATFEYTGQTLGSREVEVRAALAAQARARESFAAEGARAQALASTVRLARLRYDNGLASQLDVIDAERNLLAAELARYEALRAQRAAVADLFKALGG